MATYRDVFVFNVPTEVIRGMVKEQLSRYSWKILKDEPSSFLVEEKIFGDKPYHSSTYIGPAQIEVSVHQTSAGTEVVCDGQNEYYGDDPPPKNEHDLLNGHKRTEWDIKIKIGVIKLGLDNKLKEWSAQQRYQRVTEEKRLPQKPAQALPSVAPTQADTPQATPIALKQEKISIEDFVSQLERLATLQRSGALTNAEFEQAKLRLLKATE